MDSLARISIMMTAPRSKYTHVAFRMELDFYNKIWPPERMGIAGSAEQQQYCILKKKKTILTKVCSYIHNLDAKVCKCRISVD